MSFRQQVNDSRMILDVLHHLKSTNRELKQAAADLIFICADDQDTFKCFYKTEFMTELFQLISNVEFHENEAFMTSITGIIWKCSKAPICIRQFEVLGVIPVFNQILLNQPVQVKSHIVGAIGMCLANFTLREMVKRIGVVEIMVNLLETTYIPLIINLNDALAKGSEDIEILTQYLQLDAIQLIWSCLKNVDFQVQSCAASALCTILKNMQRANLEMKNSLDGIECIIDLLKSKRKELLTPACTLIHNLAKDKNALSVLVEFNVAFHLMRLMKIKDKKLLQQLCLAVASCCSFKKGCEKFAKCGITTPLLKHLRAKNKLLRITAALALSRIATLPNWCSISSKNKILPILTDMILDMRYEDGNKSAAVILRHILCNIENVKQIHPEKN
nr:armadillo repeat-containing protein gudu-like [Parasteatoda tepidariorum]